MDMITLGDLDFLLTLHTEQELFKSFLGMFVAMAVKEATGKGVSQMVQDRCV